MMTMKNKKDTKGFTLIEVLFAIFVGFVLMMAVLTAMNAGQRYISLQCTLGFGRSRLLVLPALL